MPRRSNGDPGWVGWLGLIVIVGFVFGTGYLVYTFVLPHSAQPKGTIALSAYFGNGNGIPVVVGDLETCKDTQLWIGGDILNAAGVKSGHVLVSADTQDRKFAQSVLVEVKDGHFDSHDAAFRSLRPSDQIHVAAKLADNSSLQQELYLNRTPPVINTSGETLLWVILGTMVLVFFYAFTGTKTRGKNRVAVIFSYVVIGLFLAVPLLGPVLLLHAFPNVMEAMIGAPAGLLVTHFNNQMEGENQWALNIGGYSFRPPKIGSQEHLSDCASVDVGTATLATPQSPQGEQPANGPLHTGSSKEAGKTEVKNTITAVPDANGATTTGSVMSTSGAKVVSASVAGGRAVIVEGGLVIPLYVIVLSVLGGAINMTRKVPRYQREGEYADLGRVARDSAGAVRSGVWRFLGQKIERTKDDESLTGRIEGETPEPKDHIELKSTPTENQSTLMPDGLNPSSAKTQTTANAQPPDEKGSPQSQLPVPPPQTTAGPEQSLNDQADVIASKLDELVMTQTKRNADTQATTADIRALTKQLSDLFESKQPEDRMLGFTSFDEWMGAHAALRELLGSSWRVELLNQYMFLIAAPFLAIVAYYILDMLGLTKQPVLVVISFSVGLISERILSWILSIATGYLRTDTASAGGHS